MRILAECIALLVGVMVTINGALMLTSPRRWFSAPPWLAYHGSLTENKYAAGWGGLQVRLTGLLTLIAIGWVLYEFLVR